MPDTSTLLLLLAWATVAGLDLVSWPQGLLARPLVAGAVAGWILGDPLAGLQVGAVLEFYALDVLPVGASRYPDYAAAAAAGTLVATSQPADAFGLGVGVGLIVAVLGGWTIQAHRRVTTSVVARASATLAAGSTAAIRRLHFGGLARDTLRALVLALVALALAALVTSLGLDPSLGRLLSLTLTGAGIAAVGAGALRSAGRGLRLRWLTLGAALGLVAVVFR